MLGISFLGVVCLVDSQPLSKMLTQKINIKWDKSVFNNVKIRHSLFLIEISTYN